MAKKKKQNYLDLIPVRNEKIGFKPEDDGSGKIALLIENTGLFNRIFQKLLKKPKVTQVHLDEIGSFVWPLIDGERTVAEIADMLGEEFGEKVNPLYERITEYFAILKTNEFIKFR